MALVEPTSGPGDQGNYNSINVLTAAKQAGVSRVVVTLSMLAMTTSPNWRDEFVEAEDYWTNIEDCKKKGVSG